MTKKALISKKESTGNVPEGKRVLEVVEVGQEFQVESSFAEWVDCPDNITGLDTYWYNPTTQQFKKTSSGTLIPDIVEGENEHYVFDWDTESWSLEPKS